MCVFVAPNYNPSPGEAETGGLLASQHVLLSEFGSVRDPMSKIINM